MQSNYWRKKPIKKFDLEQTMYSMIAEESKNDLDLEATGFLGNSMTYKELLESSDNLAKSFYNSGIKENDNVAILTINMPIVQQCLLSLSKIGATMSWIDLRAKPKDLINYINNSNCKVIVVFEDMLPMIQSIIDKTKVERVVVCSPKDYLNTAVRILAEIKDKKDKKNLVIPSDKRFVKFKDFIAEGKNICNVETANFKRNKPSLIVQSSGSTGKAKQIVHTEYNFNSEVQKMAYTDLPFYKGTTMHISVPPFIIYGLGNSIYGSLAFTMKAEMNPFVDEKTVYNDLGKFDMSLAAPLHYRYIFSQINKLENKIEKLQTSNTAETRKILRSKLKELERIYKGIERAKVFVSGGDKISSEELIEMQQTFNKTIVNGYGNNECLGATIVSPMYANKPGSIGVPMVGVDIKIVDSESGKELSKGEIGELLVSSDNLFVEYLNNETETGKIKTKDDKGKEWVKTGDLCYVDENGYIIPKGRNRRLIKKAAFKIAPDSIEDVIQSLPFVKECVVVGVNDEESMSVPMAFIELNNECCFEDVLPIIKEKCAEELPDYEIPTYYQQIEKMIYTPNGKYDFKKLEEIGNEKVEDLKQKKLMLSKKC